MKLYKKIMLIILAIIIIVIFAILIFFYVGTPKQAENINWGVVFSQEYAERFDLDWKKMYLAILDDLKTKNIKIITHWNKIEKEDDQFDWQDLDWQIEEAEKRGINIMLVVGMKTGRWPECHIPDWAKSMDAKERDDQVLFQTEQIVQRYKDKESIKSWQVENEPFFPFGECPKISEEFVKKEINLVKSIDKDTPAFTSDTGEFSFWTKVAKIGDMVGTTLHRKTHFREFDKYFTYPLRPMYYWRRAQIIKKLYNKKVICIELQAEPWCRQSLTDCPLEEQEKTMNPEEFKKNIEFAKKTGLDTFYLWGVEWWYWMKNNKNQSEMWNEAKKVLK